MFDKNNWMKQAEIVSNVLENAPFFEKGYMLPAEEFKTRQENTWNMLKQKGYDCGIVYSDEHYCGDVPYLAGNNNIIVEPIAAVLGENGLYLMAGPESAIVARQLCPRSGAKIRVMDILNLGTGRADINLNTPASIVVEACGKEPQKAAILSSKVFFPVGLYQELSEQLPQTSIDDLSEEYYKIKYNKSKLELKLIEESCRISDVMIEAMARILEPGLTEAQVAQWGYAVANELGADEQGFKIMVMSGESNKTMIGRATNKVIQEGEVVSIGVAPKRDGLCGAQRISVVCTKNPSEITDQHKVLANFLEGAFQFSVEEFERIVKEKLPGNTHEKSMIQYYKDREEEIGKKLGISIQQFSELKGYVTSHNSGYTECQEMYGALSEKFNGELPENLVLMMDVGLKGYGEDWSQVRIPGLDYLVIEKTLIKEGEQVRVLNHLPANVQELVGRSV